jgi:hypothetical protein
MSKLDIDIMFLTYRRNYLIEAANADELERVALVLLRWCLTGE